MSNMPGLTLIVAGTDAGRFHAALSLAAANAALGERTRLFLQGEAVGLLAPSRTFQGDTERSAHGIPTVAELLAEAQAMQVEVTVCQSGLALSGLRAEQLHPDIAGGGLVQILADRGDDQILVF